MATSKIAADRRGVNPNLLDNWYFAGGGSQQGGGQFPINTRGQSIYNGDVYCIDRWKLTQANSIFSVENEYIELEGTASGTIQGTYMRQIVNNWHAFAGRTVTFSALYLDNGAAKLATGTGTVPADTPAENTTVINFNNQIPHGTGCGLYAFSYDVIEAQVGVSTGYLLDIIAVKLELGDTQTLAHLENGVWVLSELPDYADQELRCHTDRGDNGDPDANWLLPKAKLDANGNPYIRFETADGDKYQFGLDANNHLTFDKDTGNGWTRIASFAPES